METGIYKITNTLNGNIYIGQSVNIKRRWFLHRNNATKTKKYYTVLERSFKKYGVDNFKFEVVEYCNMSELDSREMFYIEQLKPAYNMNEGGRGNKGFVVSEQTKKILSDKAKKQWDSYTEEQKLKVVIKQLTGPRKGKHRDEQTRKVLSEKTKQHFQEIGGMPQSQKDAISHALTGKHRPNLKHKKPVCAYTEDYKFVAVFESVKSAAEFCRIHPSSITKVLKKERKSAAGLGWQYCSQETISQESTLEKATSGSAAHPNRSDDDIVRSLLMIKVRENDKGLIDLAYRSGEMASIYAHAVYEHDEFSFEYGLEQKLIHKPAMKNRGAVVAYYAVFKLKNGGYGFAVSSVEDVTKHAKKYSQAFDSSYSPWKTEFDEMAKKTAIKAVLKYAPIKTEFVVAATHTDEAIVKADENLELHTEYEEAVEIKEIAEGAPNGELQLVEDNPR